ncbi:MAG: molybdopterin-guanine dinucleotide biosynthesis protein B [Bacillota bacterium]
MVPVISFIGYHNAGKTTVLQGVIRFFSDWGYRVGVIKHSSHDFTIDVPDTDSYRLAEAGARAVAVSSTYKLAFYKDVQRDHSLDELCRLMQDDVDIIFAEGFKRESRPKIEVARQGISRELINPDNLVALVADFPIRGAQVPVFGFDETESLCRFIQEKFMGEQ